MVLLLLTVTLLPLPPSPPNPPTAIEAEIPLSGVELLLVGCGVELGFEELDVVLFTSCVAK